MLFITWPKLVTSYQSNVPEYDKKYYLKKSKALLALCSYKVRFVKRQFKFIGLIMINDFFYFGVKSFICEWLILVTFNHNIFINFLFENTIFKIDLSNIFFRIINKGLLKIYILNTFVVHSIKLVLMPFIIAKNNAAVLNELYDIMTMHR